MAERNTSTPFSIHHFSTQPKELNILSSIKSTIREWRAGSRSLIFNLHRIGPRERQTPFDHLHGITASQFRSALLLLRSAFKVVDLSRLANTSAAGLKPCAAITFDDVPRSFVTTALPLFERYTLPVAIFPCARLANDGYGWRDIVYYILDNPALLSALERRVAKLLGAAGLEELNKKGLYSWSKQPTLRAQWLEAEILNPVLEDHRAEFVALVMRHRPYLSWDDLGQIRHHPLVTIGNHGAGHYDYRTLSAREMISDVELGHSTLKEKLGFAPQHFALPFGSLDQRVWLTLERILPDLGYKAVCWSGMHLNVWACKTRIPHLFRIHTPQGLPQLAKACLTSMARPVSTPVRALRNRRVEGQSVVDSNVSEAEYKHIHLLIAPAKKHHQSSSYYSYLFRSNPFAPEGAPYHLGLRYDGNLEAIASLFWLRFTVCGRQIGGAYFAGWWRLPEIHSADGTRRLLLAAQSMSGVLGAYRVSRYSGRLFAREGWQAVPVARFAGALRQNGERADYVVQRDYPEGLESLVAKVNSSLDFSVWRDATYYRWRFGSYPLMDYWYVVDAKPEPGWFAVAGRREGDLHVSDAVAWGFDAERGWREMLSAVARLAKDVRAKRVLMECNDRLLQRLAEAGGLRRAGEYQNFYFIAPAVKQDTKLGVDGISRMHETQATGDILPR